MYICKYIHIYIYILFFFTATFKNSLTMGLKIWKRLFNLHIITETHDFCYTI